MRIVWTGYDDDDDDGLGCVVLACIVYINAKEEKKG